VRGKIRGEAGGDRRVQRLVRDAIYGMSNQNIHENWSASGTRRHARGTEEEGQDYLTFLL
jgi:hypothetical protein